MHATIPKGNMGHDQYSVSQTAAVEATFVAFSFSTRRHMSMASLVINSFKLRSNSLRSNERKLFTA